MPVPSLADLSNAADEGMEIVALAGRRHGPIAALTLSLHNGGDATVFIDELGAHILFESIRKLFPQIVSPPASPVKVVEETATGIAIQTGHMSGS